MKWPDLRTLDIAIAIKTDDGTNGGKQIGIALMIPVSSIRTRGMNLMKHGFKQIDNDKSHAIYLKDTPESFKASDIQKWIPEFNKEVMMDEVDKKQVLSDLKSLLSFDQASDEDLLSMMQDGKSTAKTPAPLPKHSLQSDGRLFFIGSGSTIWVNDKVRSQQGDPSREELFAAIARHHQEYFRDGRKREEVSDRSAKAIAKSIVKDGFDLLYTIDWCIYRFGGNEIASAKKIIDAISLEKGGKDLLKPYEARIAGKLAAAERDISVGLYASLDQPVTPQNQPA